MKALTAALVILIVFSTLTLASATSSCPVARADFNPYNRVTVYNADGEVKGFKLVNEPFTIEAVKVQTDKTETPLSGRPVKIWIKADDGKLSLVASGSLNSQGKYTYTPTEVSDYVIEAAGKTLTLPVYMEYDDPTDFGAICGNGVCESSKLESNDNCPEDCTVCGDAKCEGLEDKDNCPDDCIICGDGICDDAEIGANECYCEVDCIVCGDGVCRSNYGEDCPEDCGGPVEIEANDEGDFISEYWWVFIVIAAAAGGIIFWKKRLDYSEEDYEDEEEEGKPEKKKKSKKSKEDDEMKDIIKELMDSGISDKRIKGKLNEYGVEDEEAWNLIKESRDE
jgi:hypothetical protein